jgi:quinol monooxygenase YgiN
VLTFVEVPATSAGDARRVLVRYIRALRQAAPKGEFQVAQDGANAGRFLLIEALAEGAALGAAETAAKPQLDPLLPLLAAPLDRRMHRELQGSAALPTSETPVAAAVYVLAHLDIGPGRGSAEGALREFATAARAAAGNAQFEVWQQLDRPNHFNLLALWHGETAPARFVQGDAARNFRASVAPSIGSPFDERRYRRIAP